MRPGCELNLDHAISVLVKTRLLPFWPDAHEWR